MSDDDPPFPFAARLDDRPKRGDDLPDDAGELVAPGDIYATVRGSRLALALEFICRDGTTFTVPYAFLPLLWWQAPGLLVIEYPGVFSVLLEGKELDELRRLIKDQRVTWVREFDAHQAAAMASAVTRIEIVQRFPSREAGSAASDAIAGQTPSCPLAAW